MFPDGQPNATNMNVDEFVRPDKHVPTILISSPTDTALFTLPPIYLFQPLMSIRNEYGYRPPGLLIDVDVHPRVRSQLPHSTVSSMFHLNVIQQFNQEHTEENVAQASSASVRRSSHYLAAPTNSARRTPTQDAAKTTCNDVDLLKQQECANTQLAQRLDKTSRYMFPIVFTMFNLFYWIYYLTMSTQDEWPLDWTDNFGELQQ
jgi:hypothetical protein